MDPLEHLVSPATRWFEPPGPFTLASGASLPRVRVAYRTWGRLNPPGTNAVLVCHALTGSADVDAWWPRLLGPGRALDPARDFIVCSNLLGSCYGTTGPASIDPSSGTRWGGTFPEVTVGDMVRLQAALCRHLGIHRIAMVIGGSLGGMLALEWAVRFPDRVGAVVPVASAARQPPWAIGFSEAQRAAIAADRHWRGGAYSASAPPSAGLAAARAMAMLSYRHWQGFAERFARERRDDGRFQAESYLHHQGKKFARRFDAASYVTLTRAMDAFDVGAGLDGGAEGVLATLPMPSLIVSVDSDLLYPMEEQAFLACHLPSAEHIVLRSPHGHDGFLIETERLDAFVREFRARHAVGGEVQPCTA